MKTKEAITSEIEQSLSASKKDVFLFYLNIVLIICLGCLFMYASASKFTDSTKFHSSLVNSPLLPFSWTGELSLAIPTICLLSSVFLFIGLQYSQLMRYALMNYLGWMIVFTVYIILILTVADYIPCSCIGLDERFSWKEQLLLNTVTIGIILMVLKWKYSYTESNIKKFLR